MKEPPDDLVAKSSILIVNSKLRDQKAASSSVTYVLCRNASPSPKDNGFSHTLFPFPRPRKPTTNIEQNVFCRRENRIADMDARALSDD